MEKKESRVGLLLSSFCTWYRQNFYDLFSIIAQQLVEFFLFLLGQFYNLGGQKSRKLSQNVIMIDVSLFHKDSLELLSINEKFTKLQFEKQRFVGKGYPSKRRVRKLFNCKLVP
eukprot:TRINITY_DN5490_c0_g1_i7.p1 TRINITY_DN5490_c0_g1~~TRINITY_DN5490_c0_g1_i7.p1  ORF type:complete len:131 (-),score=9.59 TRINITY_DN5490_c0_g1_i7:23-364(-)